MKALIFCFCSVLLFAGARAQSADSMQVYKSKNGRFEISFNSLFWGYDSLKGVKQGWDAAFLAKNIPLLSYFMESPEGTTYDTDPADIKSRLIAQWTPDTLYEVTVGPDTVGGLPMIAFSMSGQFGGGDAFVYGFIYSGDKGGFQTVFMFVPAIWTEGMREIERFMNGIRVIE